jgi:hypothetical protein
MRYFLEFVSARAPGTRSLRWKKLARNVWK